MPASARAQRQLGPARPGGRPAGIQIKEKKAPVPFEQLLPQEQLGQLQYRGRTLPCNEQDLDDLGELGRGTFGVVKKVRHKQEGVELAVKQIRDSMAPNERGRLLNEISLVRQAKSPFIVECYGVNFVEGDIWIFMELMSNSLDKVYESVSPTPFPETVLGKIASSVLRGLYYLKEEFKVMHRDLKPGNILLGFDGSIKLCDFGLAQIMEQSMLNSAVGCELYLAPERLNPATSHENYDVRSDVWSFGLTMAELAMQRYPYDCEQRNIFSLLKAIVETPAPVIPGSLKYSPSFGDFVACCLQKDKTMRPKYNKAAEAGTGASVNPLGPLMDHAFIQNNLHNEVDISAWVRANQRQPVDPVAS